MLPQVKPKVVSMQKTVLSVSWVEGSPPPLNVSPSRSVSSEIHAMELLRRVSCELLVLGAVACQPDRVVPPAGWSPVGCYELTASDRSFLLFRDSPDSLQLVDSLSRGALEGSWPGTRALLPIAAHPDTSSMMMYFWDIEEPWQTGGSRFIHLVATSGTVGWSADLRYAGDHLEGQGKPFIDVVPNDLKASALVAEPIACPERSR